MIFKKFHPSPLFTSFNSELIKEFSYKPIGGQDLNFNNTFKELKKDLRYLFQTREEVILLPMSGISAMESIICSALKPDAKILVINSGKKAKKWKEISKIYFKEVDEFYINPGRDMDLWEFEKVCSQKKYTAVMFQIVEATTGALLPVQKIIKIAKGYDITTIADALFATGTEDISFDKLKIDILLGGLTTMMPITHGFSFVIINEKTLAIMDLIIPKNFSLNLYAEFHLQKKLKTGFSLNTQALYGLQVALAYFKKFGLPDIFFHNRITAAAFRNAIESTGFDLYPDSPCSGMTAIKHKDGIDFNKLCENMETSYGIRLYPGEEELLHKIFIINHIGFNDIFEPLRILAALDFCLKDQKYSIEAGVSTSRYLNHLYEFL